VPQHGSFDYFSLFYERGDGHADTWGEQVSQRRDADEVADGHSRSGHNHSLERLVGRSKKLDRS
jgi:hypothetical protein